MNILLKREHFHKKIVIFYILNIIQKLEHSFKQDFFKIYLNKRK